MERKKERAHDPHAADDADQKKFGKKWVEVARVVGVVRGLPKKKG